MIHTYSDLFIWPVKEAQSSCSDRTAELLIKQCITHSEHCKPQLIRFGPLYYTTLTPTAGGWILTLQSSFLCPLGLCLTSLPVRSQHVSCPLVKGERVEFERGEREWQGRRNDLHTWAGRREEGRRGERRGDWTAVAWQPPQAQEEETSRSSRCRLLLTSPSSKTASSAEVSPITATHLHTELFFLLSFYTGNITWMAMMRLECANSSGM